jgi:hypothetical protein
MTDLLNRTIEELKRASLAERLRFVVALIETSKQPQAAHDDRIALLRAAFALVEQACEELAASLTVMGAFPGPAEKLVGADGSEAIVIPIDFRKGKG